MEHKIVSFKVAEAIKEAGYPQDLSVYRDGYWGHCDNIRLLNYDELDGLDYWQLCCVAPTYIDVWLWLWREKKTMLPIDGVYITQEAQVSIIESGGFKCLYVTENSDPEEAIIAAIEYLVDNNLLK